eukprot:g1933.t1
MYTSPQKNKDGGWGSFSGAPNSPPNWSKLSGNMSSNGFDSVGKDTWGSSSGGGLGDGGGEHVSGNMAVGSGGITSNGFQSVGNSAAWSASGGGISGGEHVSGNMTMSSGGGMMGGHGHMGAAVGGGGTPGTLDGEDPPLLEELGIRPDHMIKKTMAVLIPFKKISSELAHDSDMAGPVAICLALGFLLFLASGGELHFSAIYSFFLFGSFGIYAVLNLMAQFESIDILRVFSVLGYCLLPIVILAALAVIFEIATRWWASSIALVCVLWSTYTSTRFFEAGLK